MVGFADEFVDREVDAAVLGLIGDACRVVRDLMLRIFGNLLKNAYEAFLKSDGSFRPGNIEVSAKAMENGIEIEIRDNGRGMSPADLKLIQQFKLFRTLKSYGTGFGLAIAYEKIHDHNGTLSIDSVENQGTVVTIFLPQNEKEQSALRCDCQKSGNRKFS